MSVDKFGVDAEAEARFERLLAKARAQTRDIAFAHDQAKALVRDAVRLSQKTRGVDRETEAAAKLVLGVIELATGQALKRAAAAGRAAADAVTTVEQANAVLEAAAAAQESK